MILGTISYQDPLSVEFSREEYWRGLPFPSPGESFWPRDATYISCVSCTAGGFSTHWAIGKPFENGRSTQSYFYHNKVIPQGTLWSSCGQHEETDHLNSLSTFIISLNELIIRCSTFFSGLFLSSFVSSANLMLQRRCILNDTELLKVNL